MRRILPAGAAKHLPFGYRDLVWAFLVVALVSAYHLPRRTGPADTGRELDLAIMGKGYLMVRQYNSGLIGYTRNGRLSLNNCGQFIVGRPVDDWIVQPQITLPQDYQEVFISQDGLVNYRQPGNAQLQQAGQLQLCSFIAPDQLLEVAPGIFQETHHSGAAQIVNPGQQGTGLVQQGRLESPPLMSRFEWPDLWSWAVVGLAIFAIREVRKLREEVRRSREANDRVLYERYVDSASPIRNETMSPAPTKVAAFADDP